MASAAQRETADNRVCMIADLEGVLTPGDYFANGNAFVNPSLVLAGVAGAWLGCKARIQLRIGPLAILGLLCVVLWIATPTGWWAKPLPGSHLPGAPANH
jgi:hypothetical protein